MTEAELDMHGDYWKGDMASFAIYHCPFL